MRGGTRIPKTTSDHFLRAGGRVLRRALRSALPPLADEALFALRQAYDAGDDAGRKAAARCFAQACLPYEEHIRELAALGLTDTVHSGRDYAAALAAYRGAPILVKRVPDAAFEHPDPPGRPTGSPPIGRASYLDEDGAVLVELPARLSPWLYHYTLAHELGHVAASHPPRGFYAPAPGRRLARRPPLLPAVAGGLSEQAVRDAHEAEADLRAEYALLTASQGAAATHTPRLTQIS